jgi:hypothetical protein
MVKGLPYASGSTGVTVIDRPVIRQDTPYGQERLRRFVKRYTRDSVISIFVVPNKSAPLGVSVSCDRCQSSLIFPVLSV